MVTFAKHNHSPDPVLTINGPNEPNAVTFHAGGEEMLRLSPEAFYVRGKKIALDDNEAKIVYNSFKEWLTWQQLNRG
jgi:hypothetical protein